MIEALDQLDEVTGGKEGWTSSWHVGENPDRGDIDSYSLTCHLSGVFGDKREMILEQLSFVAQAAQKKYGEVFRGVRAIFQDSRNVQSNINYQLTDGGEIVEVGRGFLVPSGNGEQCDFNSLQVSLIFEGKGALGVQSDIMGNQRFKR